MVCADKFAGGSPIKSASLAFGTAVALGVYLTRDISGAHLNPAVTASCIVNDGFPAAEGAAYMLAQCTGAGLAGGLNYAMFRRGIAAMEKSLGVPRGPATQTVFDGAFGMMPNNALVKTPLGLVGIEIGLTAALLFAICGITDESRTAGSALNVSPGLQPILIGTTVGALVGVAGPVTGCGMNPARDLGPRLVTCAAGWGKAALSQGWWAYTVGPIAGGVLGGAAYSAFKSLQNQEKEDNVTF